MQWEHSSLFHQLSKTIEINTKERWVGEWSTTDYKIFPRLPKVELPATIRTHDLFEALKSRRTRRDFQNGSMSRDQISELLQFSCGETNVNADGRSCRAQPSSGRRYPIEMYALVFRQGENLEPGLYHYNVKEHLLESLWSRQWGSADIDTLFTYPWVKDAAVAFIMTSVLGRNQKKYGERGYRYILLEAGHIGQNLYLVAEALGLKCAALGGTRDEEIEKLLDIDGLSESFVYALVVGT